VFAELASNCVPINALGVLEQAEVSPIVSSTYDMRRLYAESVVA
jgi:hypothetical protein